jgi:uncharacterized membrane protein
MAEEMSMASTARSSTGRGRLGLAVAAALALTALTVSTAGAAPPPGDTGVTATAPTQSAGRTASSPRSDTPGFLLERGRFLPVAIPRGLEQLAPRGISPIGINERGQIVGSYADPAGTERGFLLEGGRFTTIDVPGAKGTQAQGINNHGQIVGVYSDTSNPSITGAQLRGFLLDHGRYRRLDFPAARSSQAYDLNDHGQVVGEYQAADATFHGYVWQRGRFRTLPTGAATGINNRGQITGVTGAVTAPDGFVLERGQLATFQVPGAQATFPYDINDHGQIVGLSAEGPTATTASGFLRDASGRVIAINRPGAAITVAFGINNRGQIVGVAANPADLASPQDPSSPPMPMTASPPSAR